MYNKFQSLPGTADYPVSEEAVCLLEGMDHLLTNPMMCAGKKCRKLDHYEFTPEVKWWFGRCQAFR